MGVIERAREGVGNVRWVVTRDGARALSSRVIEQTSERSRRGSEKAEASESVWGESSRVESQEERTRERRVAQRSTW